jgi:aryl-alcohol dehydrogenase-like predicted oxidoreductase
VREIHSLKVRRRSVLRAGIAAGSWAALRPFAAMSAEVSSLPPILRRIPSTGEQMPVVGIGTNAYDVSSSEDIAARREVLRAMPDLGGRLLDTARGYGRSEDVIGGLIAELGNRDRFFIATKPISAPQADATLTQALLDESFTRLRTRRIDLLQVHSLLRLDELLPMFMEYKRAGKIRYIGATTSVSTRHGPLLEAMRRHPLDFVQVNYSIDDRSAEREILPLAQEKRIAILNNVPLGGRGGSLFPRVAGKKLPPWAAELDVSSWAQFMLKYCIAHPAITAVIPGTTTLAHLRDNLAAGRGRLPDAAMRRRMEQFWADL